MLDGRSRTAAPAIPADQSLAISAAMQRADQLPLVPFDPLRELRAVVSPSRPLAIQPGHEEQVSGAREQKRGSRKQRVAQRVPDPAQPQFVAALAHQENIATVSPGPVAGRLSE